MSSRFPALLVTGVLAALALVACGGEESAPPCPHCCHCGCEIGTITIEAADRCLECDGDCETICLSYGGTPPTTVEPCEPEP